METSNAEALVDVITPPTEGPIKTSGQDEVPVRLRNLLQQADEWKARGLFITELEEMYAACKSDKELLLVSRRAFQVDSGSFR